MFIAGSFVSFSLLFIRLCCYHYYFTQDTEGLKSSSNQVLIVFDATSSAAAESPGFKICFTIASQYFKILFMLVINEWVLSSTYEINHSIFKCAYNGN